MLISDLRNQLASFCKKDNPFKSMLVDGKWGCGKTYTINQFVENNYKANVVYLSLFGLKRKEDIAIRLSEYLDSSFVVNINGEFSLKSPLTESRCNGAIIIFDDLERVDENLSFTSIYGVVDGLRNLGFKVICVCNSLSVDDKAFNDFKEKTFDIVINVEADVSHFPDIVDVQIGFEKVLLDTVDGNWRVIKRAAFIYNDIIKAAEENEISNLLEALDLDESSFFRCVVLAANCFFGKSKEKPDIKDQYEQISYNYDLEELGDVIGNNYYLLFNKDKENNAYRETIRLILKSLVHSDGYKEIIERVKPKVSNSKFEQYPLNQELFFLDDKGHAEYKKAFFENLFSFDFSDKQQQRIVSSIVSNCLDELTDREIEVLIEHISNVVSSDNSRELIDTLVLSNSDKSNKFEFFIGELKNAFINKLKNENIKMINDMFEKQDYRELTDFLYERKYITGEKKDSILKKLKECDFCLPDLSKTVDYSSWGFCHEAARFVAGTDYQDYYIEVLKKQCKDSNSVELKRKCNALVKYNFNLKMDFLVLFPTKNKK